MKTLVLLACLLGSCVSQPKERESAPVHADAPSVLEFQMVPLEFASAGELAPTLNQFVRADVRMRASGTQVLVDPRTNSLLVQAPQAEMPRLLDVIRKLDVRAEAPAAARR
jgi:hypothetical protein